MSIGLILSLYGNIGQTEVSETLRYNRGRQWRKAMLHLGKVPTKWKTYHIRILDEEKTWLYDTWSWYQSIFEQKNYVEKLFWYCIIQVYSHTYAFHYQKPHFWVHGWFVDWLIDNFYEVIYMFPAPRRWKVGQKTLVNWMAIFRYHRGLFINNIKTGFYWDTVKSWTGYRFVLDWPTIKRTGFYASGVIAVLLLSTFVSPAFGFLMIGTNYFFSGTGNDGNTGLSDTQAWRSLDKINNMSLGNGNTYYFKRDSSYTLSYGTEWLLRGSGHTITAYGSGAIPVWQSAALNATAGGYHTIEYINHDEKDGDGGAGGFIFGDTSGICTNVTVRHCTLTVVERWGISFSSRYLSSYATVYNCEFIEGCYNQWGHNTNHNEHSLCYNCNFYLDWGDRIQIHEGSGPIPYLEMLGPDHTVHDCFVESDNSNDLDLTSGYELYAYDCEFGQCDGPGNIFMGDICYDIEIYRNHIHSQNDGNDLILASDRQTKMWGNLLDLTTSGSYPPIGGLNFYGDNRGNGGLGDYKYDVNFYKNTTLMYRSNVTPIVVSSEAIENWHATNTRIRFKWNIVGTAYGGSPCTTKIYYNNPTYFSATDTKQEIDYNIWGTGTFQAVSGSTTYTWSQWQALGWDAHSYSNTDPLFVGGGDYHIQSGSPAHGMGPNDPANFPLSMDGYNTSTASGSHEGATDYGVEPDVFEIQLSDRVMDYGLTILNTESDRFDICSAEPTSYAEATSNPVTGYSLGSRTVTQGTLVGAPTNSDDGRKVVVIEVFGNTSYTSTATHWAITDSVNERLLATGELTSSVSISDGYGFKASSFDITIDQPS